MSRTIIVPNENDHDAIVAFYKEETEALMRSVGSEEMNRLFHYEKCEFDSDFVAFIENYADLSVLPKDITVIDIGCYMGVQGDYFKEHNAYIGVEPFVPLEWRCKVDNAQHYQMTGQQFISEILPKLLNEGLDLDRTFCICSAVPDDSLRQQIAETFPYHRVAYPSLKTLEHYPFDTPNTVKRHSEQDKSQTKTELDRD